MIRLGKVSYFIPSIVYVCGHRLYMVLGINSWGYMLLNPVSDRVGRRVGGESGRGGGGGYKGGPWGGGRGGIKGEGGEVCVECGG